MTKCPNHREIIINIVHEKGSIRLVRQIKSQFAFIQTVKFTLPG